MKYKVTWGIRGESIFEGEIKFSTEDGILKIYKLTSAKERMDCIAAYSNGSNWSIEDISNTGIK